MAVKAKPAVKAPAAEAIRPKPKAALVKPPYLAVNEDIKLRDRIEATAIILRFQDFVLGRNDVSLSRDQIRAGSILLHKVLPDMAPVDTNGTGITPIKIEIVRFGVDGPAGTITGLAGESVMIDATPLADGGKLN